MTKLIYTKDNGETSTRDVEAIGFTFGERNKVLCIDFKGLKDFEHELLKNIRQDYLDALYEAGFSSHIRSFFLDGIEVID